MQGRNNGATSISPACTLPHSALPSRVIRMAQSVIQVQFEKLDTLLLAGGTVLTVLWLLRARRNSVTARSNEPPVLPYWIPWLGHSLPYSLSGSETVFRAARCVSSEQ